MIELATKTILLSGGASGIGAAFARLAVGAGARVLIGDIAEPAGRALAQELGDRTAFVRLDVTRQADWQQAVQEAQHRFGGLNVLVNNAGIVNAGALGEYTQAQFQRILEVNLIGAFLGISAAVAALKASAPSSIVNVSSVAGLAGMSGLHGYTASKFALRGLTKSAALELASHRIRVNSVHPGPIRTPMTAGIPEAGVQARTPLGRYGEPVEIAALVAYLASDLASFSTGAEFVADGGWLAGQRQDQVSSIVGERAH